MERNFVIVAEKNGEIGYYGIDPTSGGYPWLPSELHDAKIFQDLDKAKQALANLDRYGCYGFNKDKSYIAEIVLKRLEA